MPQDNAEAPVNAGATKAKSADSQGKRTRARSLPQTDVPSVTLQQALRVPRAISDAYAKQPATPLQLATAIDMSPSSGPYRTLTAASAAYGLTDGGAWAEKIGLTPLGRRAVAPTQEGDDAAALAEAVLKPRVMGAFLRRYDQNKLPKEMIGRNVLEEMGVPAEQTQRAFNAIVESGRAVGFIYEHRGGEYVDLNRVSMPGAASEPDEAIEERGGDGGGGGDTALADIVDITGAGAITDRTPTPPPVKVEEVVNNRVFVTHGKNRAVVEQLKELLTYGGFVPVVSVEKETLAKSIPDKVLDDMRSCSAGIVHVGSEMVLKDDDGNEHKLLNSNVLIEIGAALALYGKRLILLVEEGTELPSNLQGLYQARYAGGELTHSATMKLLKTFNEFKSAPPA